MDDSFVRDMAEMVRESCASEAEKSLAMAYVRAMGKIARQNGEDPARDALLAQTPIILEIYLAPRIVRKDIEDCVAKHLADCPAGKVIQLRKGDSDGDGNGLDGGSGSGLGGINWARFAFALVSKGGWPGALTVLGIYYYPLVEKLVLR